MPTGQGSNVEKRQEHHLELDEAIQALSVLKGQLTNLLNRINRVSEPPSEKTETERDRPSLAQILDNGPQAIREYHTCCRNMVNEIEGLLFG